MTCADCKYSGMVDQLGGVRLVCRHEPPSLRPIPQQQNMAFVSMFPMVETNWWCGKHVLAMTAPLRAREAHPRDRESDRA